MGYANFFFNEGEISLVAVIVILLIYDIFGTPKSLRVFSTDSLYSRGYSYPAEYLARPGRDGFRRDVSQHGNGWGHEIHPEHRDAARVHASQ